jgi:hypothetical protein
MTTINQYNNKCNGFTKYINNKMNNGEMNGSCGDVYIGTNEEDRQKTFDCLATNSANPQSCHVGFSSWFNFDIIVKRQSSQAILIDFNPNTKSFLVETLNCVITSENRSKFSDKMYQYVKNNQKQFSNNVCAGDEQIFYENCEEIEDEVYCESKIPGSWLNSDEGFNYIKKLANEGKIAIITEDICSHEKFSRISNVISENGYSIDTLYVSNIAKYMTTDESKEAFVKSVNCLSGAKTKIIHCSPHDLEQKVIDVEKIVDTDLEGRKVSQKMLFPNFMDAFRMSKTFARHAKNL